MKKGLQILKKVGIILAVVLIFFLSLNFIPAKKAIEDEKHIILNKIETAEEKDKTLKNKEEVLIMAEKGGYLLNPANSRKAFDYVIDSTKKADIIELDVRKSKDGVLMVWEEETVNSIMLTESDEPVYFRDLTVEELKKLNLGKNFVNAKNEKPYASYTGSSIKSYGLEMLTFQEFVERYYSKPGDAFYLVDIQEVGNAGREAVDKAIEILNSDEDFANFKTRVMFSTADLDVKNYINKEYPEHLVCGKGDYVKPLLDVSKLGYQFIYNANYEAISVNMTESGLFKYNLAKRNFINKMEARNVAVIYNNVTTEEQIRQLYEIGAHVIATGDSNFVDSVITTIEKELKEANK